MEAAATNLSAAASNVSGILELQQHFGWVDYLVFVVFLVSSSLIGVYFGFIKKSDSADGMLLANRSMGVFPMSMSLIASFMSAVNMLGIPLEIYQYGTMFAYMNIAFVLMILATLCFYAPVFCRLPITSVYQYLELRFNLLTRCVASVIFVLQMTMFMSTVVYAPSLALAQVTGINAYLTSSLLFIVCIFYTTLGGMKAVMWTDVLQVLVMFTSLFVVYLKGLSDEGGLSRVWSVSKDGQRIEFDDFSPNPLVRHTFFSMVLGGSLNWLAVYGVNQSQVQRYLSVPSIRHVRRALFVNMFALVLLVGVSCFGGLIIYSKYLHCDPIQSKMVSSPDQLLPFYVADIFRGYHGVLGIFVAGIFSGSLSSVSTGLNSLAAVTLEDFLKRFFLKDLSQKTAGSITKLLTFIFGVISFGFVFLAAALGDLLQATLTILAISGGPLLGTFTLGIFFPFVNSLGASVGMIVSLFFGAWIGVGAFTSNVTKTRKPYSMDACPFNSTSLEAVAAAVQDDVPALYRVSYMWYSPITTMITIAIGVVVSLFTRRYDPIPVDKELMFRKSDLMFVDEDSKKIPKEAGLLDEACCLLDIHFRPREAEFGHHSYQTSRGT